VSATSDQDTFIHVNLRNKQKKIRNMQHLFF
jgi:hypothetical protein